MSSRQEGNPSRITHHGSRKRRRQTMRKLVLLMLGMAAVALTDWPALGGRHKVELDKIAGADFRQYKKAGALFQDALAKAKAGNASRMAIFKLEEAVIRA